MIQNKQTPERITSPFANAEASVPTKPSGNKNLLLWIGLGVILLAVGVVSGIFVTSYLNDPYRTLEPFPVAKYFEGHRAVAGAKFKGELRVEADLGWKEGIGRLMLFSAEGDSRPIAVMIPEAVGKEIYFTKGQSYLSELEVKEGGLIYANSIRKN
jgi:Predicted membrane protein